MDIVRGAPHALETPSDELERVLRAGSKSFYLASRLLPARARPATLALYAFCRKADDMVDDAKTANDAKHAVARLRARIDRVYAGRPNGTVVEQAFAPVVAHFGLPRAVLDALAEGMAWDADGKMYHSASDVRAYAARVASTVGVLMSLIIGQREPEVLSRACDLGMAMQLTNIARDVGSDARMGRVYLPDAWLRERGSSREVLLRTLEPTDAVRDATARLLQQANHLYTRADEAIAHLPPDCRASIRAARLVYSEIGRVVRRRGFDGVTSRAVVPTSRKVALVGRALAARWWTPHPLSRGFGEYNEAELLVRAVRS